jgi:hypothetical protein
MRREVDLGQLQNEDKTRQCPDCKSSEIEYRKGEFFCTKCGLVIEEEDED